jgi:hypothetical protein
MTSVGATAAGAAVVVGFAQAANPRAKIIMIKIVLRISISFLVFVFQDNFIVPKREYKTSS